MYNRHPFAPRVQRAAAGVLRCADAMRAVATLTLATSYINWSSQRDKAVAAEHGMPAWY